MKKDNVLNGKKMRKEKIQVGETKRLKKGKAKEGRGKVGRTEEKRENRWKGDDIRKRKNKVERDE